MRKLLILLGLALVPAHRAFAQSQDTAPTSGSQSTPQTSQSNTSGQAQAPGIRSRPDSIVQGQPAGSEPSAETPSVAELARLARSKKQQADPDSASAAKPHKIVLDDDNMPRGVYAPDAPLSGGAKTKSEGGSVPGAADGRPFPEYRGKVVLVDFWASWCGPCRSALPNLKRLQSIYGGDDFVVVSVSEDDDEGDWRAFTSSHQMVWPQQFDGNGNTQRQFGVHGLPTYVLIGKDGNVLQKYVGEDPARSIMERIGPDLRQALAAKP